MTKTTLGNLCLPAAKQVKLQPDDVIDYFDISSLDNISKNIIKYETYRFADAPSRARKPLKRGNVLISTVRPNLNAIAIFNQSTENFPIASTGFCVLECKPTVNPRFVFNFCCSNAFIEQMTSQATGASYPVVTDKIVRNAILPDYSLMQQNEIAYVLDNLSNIIANRKKQFSKLDELVKARFVEMFGDPKLNPYNFSCDKLSEYITFLTSGSRGWSQYFTDSGEYFITIKNVKNCKITLQDVQYVIPPDNAEAKRTKVQKNDLLISITADLGRTGVVTEEIANHGAYINQHLTCIRLKNEQVNPLYVAYYMESDAGKEQFTAKNQSAVKAGLNFNAINSLKLMVPPLSLQNQFAAFVEEVDKQKQNVQQSLDKLELLKKALMQEYFG